VSCAYVQAVLPAPTRTAIWERSGRSVNAAPVRFDRREAVTLPPLPHVKQWEAFDAARQAMVTSFANARAAARYSIR
jgi:short-subunit dehydrogenase